MSPVWFAQSVCETGLSFVGGETSASTAIDARLQGGARPGLLRSWFSDTFVSVKARSEIPKV